MIKVMGKAMLLKQRALQSTKLFEANGVHRSNREISFRKRERYGANKIGH